MDDRHEQLMMLCKGNVTEYNELKKASIGDYLVKLDRFVTEIEAMEKPKK